AECERSIRTALIFPLRSLSFVPPPWLLALGTLLLVLLPSMARSQDGPIYIAVEPVIQTGLHYYMVQDLKTGLPVLRGVAGSDGIAFDQIILAPNRPYRLWVLQALTHTIADPSIITPDVGKQFTVPDFLLRFPLTPDTDGDGLTDEE